ncbi:CPBP family intramembrane glutamic endopeptidase [Nakamurella sp. GG22]
MTGFLSRRQVLWSAWVVAALLFLSVAQPIVYGIVVPLSALLLALIPGSVPHAERSIDRVDLIVIGSLYIAVVVLYRLAFGYFTVSSVAGLFLCFAGGLLVGVVGPIVYTVRVRGRSLRTLGFRADSWRQALVLGLVFAAIQFWLTLFGYTLPADPVDWVPLLVMSLTVGLFEAVFFRGFIQTRLESSFGRIAGVGGAAAMYAMYHVGYGMHVDEMTFLFGLGVVYAVAFSIVHNLLVLWPLLTPMGGFFANVKAQSFELPWMSILGFVDVLVVMAVAVILAVRYERRRASTGHLQPSK